MWLLADLFHELPEVGDADKPKLVFFFDEAHLLFDGASKAFLDAVTQTVRLIRSKGVGIFFVTQNPQDVPGRGARPARQPRAARPARVHARTTRRRWPRRSRPTRRPTTTTSPRTCSSSAPARRSSPCCPESGAPTPVAWARMRAPRSLMAQLDPAAQQQAVAASPLQAKYGQAVDRESAYEKLAARLGPRRSAAAPAPTAPEPAAPSRRRAKQRRAGRSRPGRRVRLREGAGVARVQVLRALGGDACSAARSPAACSAPADALRPGRQGVGGAASRPRARAPGRSRAKRRVNRPCRRSATAA